MNINSNYNNSILAQKITNYLKQTNKIFGFYFLF